MAKHPLDVLQPLARVLRRAQTEPLSFALFQGTILVRNERYVNPTEHEYCVRIRDGIPISCTCPADAHYETACKHRVAVAIRRPLIDAATMMQHRLVADGGGPTAKPSQDDSEEASPADCDCSELRDDFPCWECFLAGRRDLTE